MQSASLAAPEAVAVDSCPNSARWRRRVVGSPSTWLVVEWTCEQVGRLWSLERSLSFVEVAVGRDRQMQTYGPGEEHAALRWAWSWLEQHGAPARPEGWAS